MPRNKTTATVWHNIATDVTSRPIAMLDGYMPGHPLVPVARWPHHNARIVQRVCNEIFMLCNLGVDEKGESGNSRALEYRGHRNRPLTVGDVIQLNDKASDRWFTYSNTKDETEWRPIPAPIWFAIGARAPGTLSLPPELFVPPEPRRPNRWPKVNGGPEQTHERLRDDQ